MSEKALTALWMVIMLIVSLSILEALLDLQTLLEKATGIVIW